MKVEREIRFSASWFEIAVTIVGLVIFGRKLTAPGGTDIATLVLAAVFIAASCVALFTYEKREVSDE